MRQGSRMTLRQRHRALRLRFAACRLRLQFSERRQTFRPFLGRAARHLVESRRHLEDFFCAIAKDAALLYFFRMQDHRVVAKLVFHLSHGVLHRGGLKHLDAQLNSHRPKNLKFNRLLDFRMREYDKPLHGAFDKLPEVGAHGRACEHDRFVAHVRELRQFRIE